MAYLLMPGVQLYGEHLRLLGVRSMREWKGFYQAMCKIKQEIKRHTDGTEIILTCADAGYDIISSDEYGMYCKAGCHHEADRAAQGSNRAHINAVIDSVEW